VSAGARAGWDGAAAGVRPGVVRELIGIDPAAGLTPAQASAALAATRAERAEAVRVHAELARLSWARAAAVSYVLRRLSSYWPQPDAAGLTLGEVLTLVPADVARDCLAALARVGLAGPDPGEEASPAAGG
jgi:hypothetical protein